MTYFAHIALRPLYPRVTVARLAVAATFVIWFERLLATVAVSLLVVIGLQFAYPSDHVRPLARVGSMSVGRASQTELIRRLDSLNTRPLSLQVGQKTYQLQFKDSGQTVDSSAISQRLLAYGWRERLQPFSLLRQPAAVGLTYQTDAAAQTALVQRLIAENQLAPKDAALTKQADGSYLVVPETAGRRTDEAAVRSSLATIDPMRDTPVVLAQATVEPAITTKTAEAAASQLKATQAAPPVITYNDKEYSPTADQIKAWTQIAADPATGKINISYDTAAIRNWLAGQLPLVTTAPQNGSTTIVDGVVTARTPSSNGSGLDLDETAISLSTALQSGTPEIKASLKVLSSREKYIRHYNPTSAGITALIADWKAEYPNLRAGVMFMELGGQGRSAGLNADQQFTTASVYKLFVAQYVYKGIEDGSIDPNSIIAGRTVKACLESMIVISSNTCGLGFGDKYGWANIDAFAKARGYGGTSLANRPLLSTPTDIAKFFQDLVTNQSLNGDHTGRLLGHMARQVVRSAIPAGSPGSTVQNKIGYIPGVWNDAGIVYTPKANYVLVVMTNSNPATIKVLANRIHTLLQQ